jgi:hypothetical protein
MPTRASVRFSPRMALLNAVAERRDHVTVDLQSLSEFGRASDSCSLEPGRTVLVVSCKSVIQLLL